MLKFGGFFKFGKMELFVQSLSVVACIDFKCRQGRYDIYGTYRPTIFVINVAQWLAGVARVVGQRVAELNV